MGKDDQHVDPVQATVKQELSEGCDVMFFYMFTIAAFLVNFGWCFAPITGFILVAL